MTDREVSHRIDDKLEEIKNHLMSLFGNEGSDIGDASNYAELLGNTIPHINAPHDSYTMAEFLTVVSVVADIPTTDLMRLYNNMTTWSPERFHLEGAWLGF